MINECVGAIYKTFFRLPDTKITYKWKAIITKFKFWNRWEIFRGYWFVTSSKQRKHSIIMAKKRFGKPYKSKSK